MSWLYDREEIDQLAGIYLCGAAYTMDVIRGHESTHKLRSLGAVSDVYAINEESTITSDVIDNVLLGGSPLKVIKVVCKQLYHSPYFTWPAM